jgi:hypothetical protein
MVDIGWDALDLAGTHDNVDDRIGLGDEPQRTLLDTSRPHVPGCSRSTVESRPEAAFPTRAGRQLLKLDTYFRRAGFEPIHQLEEGGWIITWGTTPGAFAFPDK